MDFQTSCQDQWDTRNIHIFSSRGVLCKPLAIICKPPRENFNEQKLKSSLQLFRTEEGGTAVIGSTSDTWPQWSNRRSQQFLKQAFHRMLHLQKTKPSRKNPLTANLGNNSSQTIPLQVDLIAQGNGNKAPTAGIPTAGLEIATDCQGELQTRDRRGKGQK